MYIRASINRLQLTGRRSLVYKRTLNDLRLLSQPSSQFKRRPRFKSLLVTVPPSTRLLRYDRHSVDLGAGTIVTEFLGL